MIWTSDTKLQPSACDYVLLWWSSCTQTEAKLNEALSAQHALLFGQAQGSLQSQRQVQSGNTATWALCTSKHGHYGGRKLPLQCRVLATAGKRAEQSREREYMPLPISWQHLVNYPHWDLSPQRHWWLWQRWAWWPECLQSRGSHWMISRWNDCWEFLHTDHFLKCHSSLYQLQARVPMLHLSGCIHLQGERLYSNNQYGWRWLRSSCLSYRDTHAMFTNHES